MEGEADDLLHAPHDVVVAYPARLEQRQFIVFCHGDDILNLHQQLPALLRVETRQRSAHDDDDDDDDDNEATRQFRV